MCHGLDCNNEALEDHHIISRGRLLTRWAMWNHILIGRMHHERADGVRGWVEKNWPVAWRLIRRAEMRLNNVRYGKDRNMSPVRIRARIRARIKAASVFEEMAECVKEVEGLIVCFGKPVHKQWQYVEKR
jgi:hypothetical protein